MPIKAGADFNADCLLRDLAPPAGTAASVVMRSFSRLFRQPAKTQPKIVYSAPPSPEGGHAISQESSLQGGKAALQWAKFSTDEALHCPICHSGHPDLARLARVLGVLPIGAKVVLPVISRILGEKFSTVTHDLNFLSCRLKAPIKWNSHGILLQAPFAICGKCVQIGSQLRQTYPFQKNFKAALPKVAGLASIRVLPSGGLEESPIHSPS